MKTIELIKTLEKHAKKVLLFEYDTNKYAGTNYHLTEIKNVLFNSVDCGGKTNQWKETHFQLWESPDEIGKEDYLSVQKVLDIINRVDRIHSIWKDTAVKIEFGNAAFHTSILDITGFKINDNQLIVNLSSIKTGCKAGDLCGVEESVSSCCETEKPIEKEASCCGTESKCC